MDEDNTVLYKEIGRLNRQVLDLMDEKAKILNMKVGTVNGGAILTEGSEATVTGAAGMVILWFLLRRKSLRPATNAA